MIPIAKPFLGDEEVRAAQEAILSGWVSQGPKVKQFEDDFAAYVGAAHAVAVTNCTTALHLALLVVGIRPGDRVVTVSHSFITTANCIRYCGAEPLFVDIDPATFNLSPDGLEKCLVDAGDPKPAAIVAVHQMGMPCDLSRILAIARKNNIPVIEDAACAVGSEVSPDGKNWEKIGRPHGDIACFSFHPRKVITTGEGGMLTTGNAEYDQKLRLLRHQGMSVSDRERHASQKIIFEEYPVLGYNYRLTDIQAAIGLAQMKKLPAIIQKRRELGEQYKKGLADVAWLKLPEEPECCRTNWQSFAVRLLEGAPVSRDALMQYLLDEGIATRRGIMNAHQEKVYAGKNYSLPESEKARDDAVLLPLFYEMTDEECARCVARIKGAS